MKTRNTDNKPEAEAKDVNSIDNNINKTNIADLDVKEEVGKAKEEERPKKQEKKKEEEEKKQKQSVIVPDVIDLESSWEHESVPQSSRLNEEESNIIEIEEPEYRKEEEQGGDQQEQEEEMDDPMELLRRMTLRRQDKPPNPPPSTSSLPPNLQRRRNSEEEQIEIESKYIKPTEQIVQTNNTKEKVEKKRASTNIEEILKVNKAKPISNEIQQPGKGELEEEQDTEVESNIGIKVSRETIDDETNKNKRSEKQEKRKTIELVEQILVSKSSNNKLLEPPTTTNSLESSQEFEITESNPKNLESLQEQQKLPQPSLLPEKKEKRHTRDLDEEKKISSSLKSSGSLSNSSKAQLEKEEQQQQKLISTLEPEKVKFVENKEKRRTRDLDEERIKPYSASTILVPSSSLVDKDEKEKESKIRVNERFQKFITDVYGENTMEQEKQQNPEKENNKTEKVKKKKKLERSTSTKLRKEIKKEKEREVQKEPHSQGHAQGGEEGKKSKKKKKDKDEKDKDKDSKKKKLERSASTKLKKEIIKKDKHEGETTEKEKEKGKKDKDGKKKKDKKNRTSLKVGSSIRFKQQQAEDVRIEKERIQKEQKPDKEKLEKEKLDKLEKERIEKEKFEKSEKERIKKEEIERQRMEKEIQQKLEAEQKLEKEKQKLEAEQKLEKERIERETLQKEKEKEKEQSNQKQIGQEDDYKIDTSQEFNILKRFFDSNSSSSTSPSPFSDSSSIIDEDELIKTVSEKTINKVTLSNYPELSLVLNSNSDNNTTPNHNSNLKTNEILIKWINYHLKNTNLNIQINNITTDLENGVILAHLLSEIIPQGSTNTLVEEIQNEKSAEIRSAKIIEKLKTRIWK